MIRGSFSGDRLLPTIVHGDPFFKDSHHPRYTPLAKAEDAAVKLAGARASDEEKAFLDPASDKS